MKAETKPTVKAQMLIRKPVAEVFEAMINPQITTNFWFTKSSGKLETGKILTWEWEMYGAVANVEVLEIIPQKKISFLWGDPATTVDFNFTIVSPETTYVEVETYGFTQTGDELITTIVDQTGGFTTVLDGMKAYLEHNLKLNLIADKFLKS